MDQDAKDLLTRIAVALEKLAAKPVPLPNGWVWCETAHEWKQLGEYETGRNA